MNRRSITRALSVAALLAAYVCAAQWALAANSFYNASGTPAQGSALSSAAMRGEFASIGAGFDRMPALTAGTAIVVNPGGTALANTIGTLALAGNFATTGAFNTTFIQSANISLTLPGTSDTLVGRATTDTLTNKSMSGVSNTFTNIPISTAISGLGTGIASALATNVGSAGAPVIFNGALGTPSSGTLTNATGCAISTCISGLGAGVGSFLGAPSSANLASALTDKTGTGVNVFATSPTLVTPILGVAAATSINKVVLTAPASAATLTIADGKTLTVSNSITLAATDGSSPFTLPTRQVLTSGTGATYTTPAGVRQLRIRMVGAGGGGGGYNNSGNGVAGGDTSFNSIVAKGGSGGTQGGSSTLGGGGAGGTGGTGSASLRRTGQDGITGTYAVVNAQANASQPGGNSLLGSGSSSTGSAASANTGGGGAGGASVTTTISGGGGGGAGEYVELIINSPSGTYTYTIGAGGTSAAGSAGGSGVILVDEIY